MNRTRTFAIATGLLTVAYVPLLAQGRGVGNPGHPKGASKPGVEAAPVHPRAASRRATTDEVRAIQSYYRTGHGDVKPIPPGMLRNLVRGKPLPPGIDRTRIPDDLSVRLLARPGHTWYVVGDRLVLLAQNGLVVDIVRR